MARSVIATLEDYQTWTEALVRISRSDALEEVKTRHEKLRSEWNEFCDQMEASGHSPARYFEYLVTISQNFTDAARVIEERENGVSSSESGTAS